MNTNRSNSYESEVHLNNPGFLFDNLEDPYDGLSSDVISNLNHVTSGNYKEKYFMETLKISNNLAKKSTRNAFFYKTLNIIISMSIVILSCAICIVSSFYENFVITILSTVIVAIQICHEIFQLGKKGIYLKYASIRLFNLYNTLIETLADAVSSNELYTSAKIVRQEIKDIEFVLFYMSYGPTSIKSAGTQVTFDKENVDPSKDFGPEKMV